MTALPLEVRDLRESVAAVLARESNLDVVRQAATEPSRWEGLWELITELGWATIPIPEAAGGLELGAVVQVGILEEAGRAMLPAPLLSTTMAGALLARAPEGEARNAALESIAEGAPATVGCADDRLVGTVTGVPDGDRSAVVVILGPGRHMGVTTREQVNATGGPGPDPNRPIRTLTVDVPASPVMEGPPCAALISIARTLQAAELIGVAARALAVATEHAGTRTQFGQVIGTFQGVKHRLADDYVALERGRSLVVAAAQAIDAGAEGPQLEEIGRMAKAAAGDAAMSGVRHAVQVLGALGTTAESELSWLLRRARVGAFLLGDARSHYEWVGRRRREGGA